MLPLIDLVLWNTCWAAALAVIAWVAGRSPLLRRRPAVLHLLWFGVLLRLVTPSVVPIPVLPRHEHPANPSAAPSSAIAVPAVSPVPPPAVSPPAETETHGITEAAISETIAPKDRPAPRVEVPLSAGLAATSLFGSIIFLTISSHRLRRIVRLLAASQTASTRFVDLVEQVARRMGIAMSPQVRVVVGLAIPSIWIGWRKATILLPQHLLETLDDRQWSCVLAHELGHVVRRDHVFNLVAAGIVYLQWWNPVAWWAWRQMQARQEVCCDALAIEREPQSRRLYAETLLRVVEACNLKAPVRPQVLLGLGNRSVLESRFEMIANASVRPRAAAAIAVCLSVAALSFVVLPVRAGSQVQQPQQE